MITEHTVPCGRLRLNVATTGDGPPLVMFHGVTRSWQSFLPLLPSLSMRWQVQAIDFRGHGASDRDPVGDYLVVDYAQEAAAFMHEHIGRPARVYGHSLGAMVAAAVAADLPELVRAVVLEDPPFETMGRRIHQTRLASFFEGMRPLAGSTLPLAELARHVAELRFTDPETGESQRLGNLRDPAALRFTAWSLSRLDPRVLESIVEDGWLDGYQRHDILRKIACPVLLLQADADAGGMLREVDAGEAESLIPDCTRVRLPGTGHLMHWQRTQDTINLVTSFFETVDSASESPR